MGIERGGEQAAYARQRSDQIKQSTNNSINLSTFNAQSMQSHTQQQQQQQQQHPFYEQRRHSFGNMAPPHSLQTSHVQHYDNALPEQQQQQAQQFQGQYQSNVQASQLSATTNTAAPSLQQFQPQQAAQQAQYSNDVDYLVQGQQQPQQTSSETQWTQQSANSPNELFAYSLANVAVKKEFCPQQMQVAPPDCTSYPANCQPGSPMSMQTPSPEGATGLLQALSMTPPAPSSTHSNLCGLSSGAGPNSNSGQSSGSCGRIASPSGASSTISSSESIGNMSINLEQYISKRNERERSRVRNVNDAFDNLKNSLPLEMEKLSKRMSKVEILRTAISYIKNLEEVLGYKQQQQQQTRDDRAILQQQQQQQQQQHAGSGQSNAMIRKRQRSGSVGHLMRSTFAQHQRALIQERALDCENSAQLAWRHERPASSLSGHDLLILGDEFAHNTGSNAGLLKRKLDFNHHDQLDRYAQPGNQSHTTTVQQMPTSCRQDNFRQQQMLVQNYRCCQQQQQRPHPNYRQLNQSLHHNHQPDHEMGEHTSEPSGGFDEFNPNVRCYNERNFDNY